MNENRQNTTLHIEQAIKAKEDLHRQYTVLEWVLEIEAMSESGRALSDRVCLLRARDNDEGESGGSKSNA